MNPTLRWLSEESNEIGESLRLQHRFESVGHQRGLGVV